MKLSLIGVSLIGVFTVGCGGLTSDVSCTRKNDTTKQPEKCIELSKFNAATAAEAKLALAALCKGLGASIESKDCDTTGAVLGCEEAGSAWTTGTWYYPTTAKPTVADYFCQSGEKRLGADRQPLQANDMSVTADLSSHD